MKKGSLKILLIIFFMFLFLPVGVFAHPGRLDGKDCHYCRTNCAKWGLNDNEYHCHNGDTYSNSRSQIFNRDGVKISDGNNVPTESTPQPTPSSETTQENQANPPVSNDDNNNNISSSTNKPSVNTSTDSEDKLDEAEEIKNENKKSNDTTIKTLKVNGKNVDMVDNMFVETTKKTLDLKITVGNKNSKVDYEQKELVIGENEIKIKVTAEDGTEKEYKLIIKRVEGPGTVTIEELSLDSYSIEFDNYKAEISITKGETIEGISYKLSDENAILKLYVNDKEVKRITKLKGNNILTLVTIDEDNNKLTYEVYINEMGLIESVIFNTITYGLIAVMLGGPFVGGVFAVNFIKKKIKK